jgi:DNA-binding NarL/FixJ family response regulator
MKKVVIADDHEIIREALKRLLENFDWVGEAGDGEAALELVRENKPDLILLDLSMPKRTGMSIIKEIRACHEDIKILVVTIHDSRHNARDALAAGANGYFLKDENVSNLRSAISCVMAGGRYVSPIVGQSDCDQDHRPPPRRVKTK